MTGYIAGWDGCLVHLPAKRRRRNPGLVIDTGADHVEAIAFAHGSQVEADGTHMFTVYAGITYRAKLSGGAA